MGEEGTVRLQGVVINKGADKNWGDYLVLYCREYNHCFACAKDIDDMAWSEALPAVWCEFDVETYETGEIFSPPAGVKYRAANLEVLDFGHPRSLNPCTVLEEHRLNIHRFNHIKQFMVDSKVLSFKTTCYLSPMARRDDHCHGQSQFVFDKYIGPVPIDAHEYCEMARFNVEEFDCQIELTPPPVPTPSINYPSAWRIRHFVYEGRMLTFQGYMSIRGFYSRDSGGNARDRVSITMLPDTLRPAGPSRPSKWSTGVYPTTYDNSAQRQLEKEQSKQYCAGIQTGFLVFKPSSVANRVASSTPLDVNEADGTLNESRESHEQQSDNTNYTSHSPSSGRVEPVMDRNRAFYSSEFRRQEDPGPSGMQYDSRFEADVQQPLTKVHGLVIGRDGIGWRFCSIDYDRVLYIHLNEDLSIGTWIRFSYRGGRENITDDLISHANSCDWSYEEPPRDTLTRFIPNSRIDMLDGLLILTIQVDVYMNGGDGYLIFWKNFKWPIEHDPSLIPPSVVQGVPVVVEITPQKTHYGFTLLKFHGELGDINMVSNPFIPLNIRSLTEWEDEQDRWIREQRELEEDRQLELERVREMERQYMENKRREEEKRRREEEDWNRKQEEEERKRRLAEEAEARRQREEEERRRIQEEERRRDVERRQQQLKYELQQQQMMRQQQQAAQRQQAAQPPHQQQVPRPVSQQMHQTNAPPLTPRYQGGPPQGPTYVPQQHVQQGPPQAPQPAYQPQPQVRQEPPLTPHPLYQRLQSQQQVHQGAPHPHLPPTQAYQEPPQGHQVHRPPSQVSHQGGPPQQRQLLQPQHQQQHSQYQAILLPSGPQAPSQGYPQQPNHFPIQQNTMQQPHINQQMPLQQQQQQQQQQYTQDSRQQHPQGIHQSSQPQYSQNVLAAPQHGQVPGYQLPPNKPGAPIYQPVPQHPQGNIQGPAQQVQPRQGAPQQYPAGPQPVYPQASYIPQQPGLQRHQQHLIPQNGAPWPPSQSQSVASSTNPTPVQSAYAQQQSRIQVLAANPGAPPQPQRQNTTFGANHFRPIPNCQPQSAPPSSIAVPTPTVSYNHQGNLIQQQPTPPQEGLRQEKIAPQVQAVQTTDTQGKGQKGVGSSSQQRWVEDQLKRQRGLKEGKKTAAEEKETKEKVQKAKKKEGEVLGNDGSEPEAIVEKFEVVRTAANSLVGVRLQSEESSGRNPLQYLCVVVKVEPTHVILYTPCEPVRNVLARIELFGIPAAKIGLGSWWSLIAEERRRQSYDNYCKPLFSHIATEIREKAAPPLPNWRQRIAAGVLEIEMTFELKNINETDIPLEREGDKMYYTFDKNFIKFLIRRERIRAYLMEAKGGTRKLRTWVTRLRNKFGFVMRVLPSTFILQVNDDGTTSPIFPDMAETNSAEQLHETDETIKESTTSA